MSPHPMSCHLLPRRVWRLKTSRAEFSCRQTGCFTSTVPQLPVTLTVAGFKSGLALELPGYTWRRAIK